MIPKCRECENTEFQDMNGRPNRWYCGHPEAKERHHTEMTIKTCPKWSPRRIKDGKK